MKPTGPVQTWLAEHDPLAVVPLTDVVIDKVGHHACDPYVETFWLPLVGPSALWALRRLAAGLERSPDGISVPIGPLAGELGLGHLNGRNSPMIRTLARLVSFDLAAVMPDDTFAVRTMIPPLCRRNILRLPDHLAEAHAVDQLRVLHPSKVVTGAA